MKERKKHRHPSPRMALTRNFEKKLAKDGGENEKYVLRLYVAGASVKSRQALLRVRDLCADELKNGHCDLQVIDVYQQPILARDGQIIATPTLVREFPGPVRRLIGDLTNTRRLIVGIDWTSKQGEDGK